MRTTKSIAVGVIALALFVTSECWAAIATFDDLSPGIYSSVLGDGGIVFFNAVSIGGPGATFSIENFSGNAEIAPAQGYSSPNMLTIGGYAPGNGGGSGNFHRFEFEVSDDGINIRPCSSASIAIFTFNTSSGAVITLEGIKNGSVVASSSYNVPGISGNEQTLSVSGGEFDSFAVVSSGTYNNGYSLACFDSVTAVVSVPEPTSLGLGSLALLILQRRRSADGSPSPVRA